MEPIVVDVMDVTSPGATGHGISVEAKSEHKSVVLSCTLMPDNVATE
jgi:hypothetical protein